MITPTTSNMAGMDNIAEKLDSLTQSVDTMSKELKDLSSSVDNKIELLRESLIKRFDTALKGIKAELRKELKAQMDNEVKKGLEGVKNDITSMKSNIGTANSDIAKVRAKVDLPFNPNQSVVIFGKKKRHQRKLCTV